MDSDWLKPKPGVSVEWLAAVRGLGDDPIVGADYDQGQPPSRSGPIFASVIAGLMLLALAILLWMGFERTAPAAGASASLASLFAQAGALTWLLAVVWFSVAWKQSMSTAASALSTFNPSQQPERLARLTAMRSLPPAAVVLGTLWHNLLPLMWPVLLGLVAAAEFRLAQVLQVAFSAPDYAAMLDWAPVALEPRLALLGAVPALMGQFLCGLLAASFLLLAGIIFGRGLNWRFANGAATAYWYSHVGWLVLFGAVCFGFGFRNEGSSMWEDLWDWVYWPEHFYFALYVYAGTAALLVFLLWAGQGSRFMRRRLLVALPLTLFASWALMLYWIFHTYSLDQISYQAVELALNFTLACGVIQTINPLVVPFATAFGIPPDQAAYYPLFEWYRFPLTVGVLVLLNLAALGFARQAVILRFREDP